MAEAEQHRMVGEHKYENMYLTDNYRPEVLDRIRKIDFAGDVLVASYPKTGKRTTIIM